MCIGIVLRKPEPVSPEMTEPVFHIVRIRVPDGTAGQTFWHPNLSIRKRRQKFLFCRRCLFKWLFLKILYWFCPIIFQNFFAKPAYRAYPTVRQIFKWCAGGNSAVRVAGFRVVNVAARAANIFFHDNAHPLFMIILSVQSYFVHFYKFHSNVLRKGCN